MQAHNTPKSSKKLLSYMVGAGVAGVSGTGAAALQSYLYAPLVAVDTDPVGQVIINPPPMMGPPYDVSTFEEILINLNTGAGVVGGPPPTVKGGPTPFGVLAMLPGDTKVDSFKSGPKTVSGPGFAVADDGVQVAKGGSLPGATIVGPNLKWKGGTFLGGFDGGFKTDGDLFLGVRLSAGGGNYYYGWVRYAYGSLEVKELVLEDQVNVPVHIPLPAPVPVQFAAPLAALATGLAGLAALRRRRRKQLAA